jgi:DNA-binding CsgD family transcriptional regulator
MPPNAGSIAHTAPLTTASQQAEVQPGDRALAEQAETELRATGARPRRVLLTGLDSLTASERRIAELAGQGMTNREIAQALFITARTVEGHLTSVFRKLELDSRDQLAATLDVGAEASV